MSWASSLYYNIWMSNFDLQEYVREMNNEIFLSENQLNGLYIMLLLRLPSQWDHILYSTLNADRDKRIRTKWPPSSTTEWFKWILSWVSCSGPMNKRSRTARSAKSRSLWVFSGPNTKACTSTYRSPFIISPTIAAKKHRTKNRRKSWTLILNSWGYFMGSRMWQHSVGWGLVDIS